MRLALFLAFLFSFEADCASNVLPPSIAFSRVSASNLTGLAYDESAPMVIDRAKLKAQVRALIQIRRASPTAKERLLGLASCANSPASNLFCEWMAGRSARDLPAQATAPPQSRLLGPADEVFGATDGLGVLAHAAPDWSEMPDAQIRRVLRKVKSIEQLQGLAPTVESGTCSNSALATALGQKAEEYFPEESVRRLAISLYERAIECAKGPIDIAEKARFRLSLLKIWEGRCTDAERDLKILSDRRESDYSALSLFWRAQCATQSGHQADFLALRAEFLKLYPLSYHALLLHRFEEHEISKVLELPEPTVQLRSSTRADLNALVEGVEYLLERNQPGIAADILESVTGRAQSTEAGFRLYLALLLNRSDRSISAFRELSALFQQYPVLVSRSTLEVFYPLKRFALLKKYSRSVDPYLIAALIRQESGFNDRARSHVGAQGWMQLMPATARRYRAFKHDSLYSPETNVQIGSKYFSALLDRYNGDAELALAAYNAGPDKVDEWVKRYATPTRELFLDLIPYAETRSYVSLIGRNYFWYLHLYGDPIPSVDADSGRRVASAQKKAAHPRSKAYFSWTRSPST